MAKLSTKRATRIAVLYNSYIVADTFVDRALKSRDTESYRIWHNQRIEACRELYEEFGIDVVGGCRRNLTSSEQRAAA